MAASTQRTMEIVMGTEPSMTSGAGSFQGLHTIPGAGRSYSPNRVWGDCCYYIARGQFDPERSIYLHMNDAGTKKSYRLIIRSRKVVGFEMVAIDGAVVHVLDVNEITELINSILAQDF